MAGPRLRSIATIHSKVTTDAATAPTADRLLAIPLAVLPLILPARLRADPLEIGGTIIPMITGHRDEENATREAAMEEITMARPDNLLYRLSASFSTASISHCLSRSRCVLNRTK